MLHIPRATHDRVKARAGIRKHHIDLPALKVTVPILLAAMIGAIFSVVGAIAWIKMMLGYSDAGLYFCNQPDPVALYFAGDDAACESSQHCVMTLNAAMDKVMREDLCPGRVVSRVVQDEVQKSLPSQQAEVT